MELRQIREDRARNARQVFCFKSGKGTLGAGWHVSQMQLPLYFGVTEASSVLKAFKILILQGLYLDIVLRQNLKAQN